MANGDFIQKQERKGKYILTGLMIMNAVIYLLLATINLRSGRLNTVVGSMLMMILCALIYLGQPYAKWIYIVVICIQLLSTTYSLTSGLEPSIFVLLTLVLMVPSIVTAIVLFRSNSVKEFMYKQSI